MGKPVDIVQGTVDFLILKTIALGWPPTESPGKSENSESAWLLAQAARTSHDSSFDAGRRWL
jgi:hypothetical protein